MTKLKNQYLNGIKLRGNKVTLVVNSRAEQAISIC